MRSISTGRLVPARCNSHLCPDCSPLHQLTARTAIERGILRASAAVRRDAVVFVTLTEPARASLDLPRFADRWRATRKRLARSWGLSAYALAVEFQQRGALHPHIFGVVGDQVADDLRDRSSRASYRRRLHELRPLAESLGWGQMVDAVTVPMGEAAEVGRYGAKAVAGYATKEAAERFKRAGARKVRPLRLSYDWIPGGLGAVRESLTAAIDGATDPGPWERVKAVGTCS